MCIFQTYFCYQSMLIKSYAFFFVCALSLYVHSKLYEHVHVLKRIKYQTDSFDVFGVSGSVCAAYLRCTLVLYYFRWTCRMDWTLSACVGLCLCFEESAPGRALCVYLHDAGT